MLNNNLPFLIGLNSCSYVEDPFLLYLALRGCGWVFSGSATFIMFLKASTETRTTLACLSAVSEASTRSSIFVDTWAKKFFKVLRLDFSFFGYFWILLCISPAYFVALFFSSPSVVLKSTVRVLSRFSRYS